MLHGNRRFWMQMFAGIAAVTAALTVMSAQNDAPRAVEELLPAQTVLFLQHDGAEMHSQGWQKTAAHEAIYESGLVEVVEKVLKFASQLSGASNNPQVNQAVQHVGAHGASLAISLPDPEDPSVPQATIVFHEAAKLEPLLSGLAKNIGGMVGARFNTREQIGRSVTSTLVPNTPGIEVGMWAEGDHLVVVAGPNSVASMLAVASRQAPNLTTNSDWKKHSNQRSFETTSGWWLDFESVRKSLKKMPLPSQPEKTFGDLLENLGLHNVGTVAHRSGFQGRALWSSTSVEVQGRRSGVLALTNQGPMTLADLPPLPVNTSGFYATRIDPSASWDALTQLVRAGAMFSPPKAAAQVDQFLRSLSEAIDPQGELLASMGDVVCAFSDPDQGFLGTGMGLAVEVDDATKVRAALDRVLEMAKQSSQGKFAWHRVQKKEHELILFEFAGAQVGALGVHEEWLVAGLMPQSVEATLLRLDGKLDRWQPSPAQAGALAELPKSFGSISVGDPRVSWQAFVKLAPAILSGSSISLKKNQLLPPDAELPITMAAVPPAELVVRPLFPNVTVHTIDAEGIVVTSRKSVPGIPLVSSFGNGQEIVTVATVAGLLLPAVSSARAAARRQVSANNLKQIALALHNYHDAYKSFPAGTHPNEKLNPEERLSWMASILPFINEQPVHETIDFEEAWDDQTNNEAATTQVRAYRHPSHGAANDGPAESHYVGIAGRGKNAHLLPVTNERAGIFGVNRKTSIRDIKDGTSNTVMISEATAEFGPWIAGGRATMRSFTKQPYINGPDGIGGPSPGGCNVAMGDGSIRFLSENVDPEVVEAMSTINGREAVFGF